MLTEVLISLISGVVSGLIVGLFFKRIEDKRSFNRRKGEMQTELVFYLVELNDEIMYELEDQQEGKRRIKKLLGRRVDLLSKAAKYADKESLFQVQDALINIEKEVDKNRANVETIDNNLKTALHEVGVAFQKQ